jgi:elongation factor Ts
VCGSYSQAIVGKPPQVVEKIVAGKVSKWLSWACLVNQPFIKDDKTTIKQLIANVSGTVGEKIEIKKFVRFSA